MRNKYFHRFVMLFAMLWLPALAQAGLITRTITIDGVFTDWDGTGGSYSPSGSILSNTNQNSTDCKSGDACERDGNLKSVGRDLKRFAFTWDNSNLYFYLERWDSSSNVTDWWFYMDTNGDLKMNTGEKVLRVNWSGTNQSTGVTVWTYSAAATGGDPLVGPSGFADGYTMPGVLGNETAVYAANGGGSNGLQMEAYMPWSVLGSSGPTNMGFHVSSSNGSNIPSSTIDNMDGPNGNQLFPADLQVGKTASTTVVDANSSFTYTLTASNLGYQPFTGVALSDVLPADTVFQSYSATLGSFVDTNGNGIPDRWNVGTLVAQQTAMLVITVKAANVTAAETVVNTASLVAYAGQNFYTGNDAASVSVTINPSPLLSVTKVASAAAVNPGQTLRYTVYISNIGYAAATAVVAVDALSPFTAFRLDTFGAGQNVQFTQGTPSSTLTLGTPTYSSNNGGTYTYIPVSGGGGAPVGYDANVTNVRIPMTGTMATSGANFMLKYDAMVR